MGKKVQNVSKNLLFGKKDTGVADRQLELDPSLGRVTEAGRALQEKALGGYGDLLAQNQQISQFQGAQLEKQARQGVADAQMQAQRAVAQRGLGNSTVGLNAILNPQRNLGDRLEEIRASLPSLQLQNLQNITGGINNILGARGAERAFIQGREGLGRTGGLLAAGLAMGGAYAGKQIGGEEGAKYGGQAGYGLGRNIGNS